MTTKAREALEALRILVDSSDLIDPDTPADIIRSFLSQPPERGGEDALKAKLTDAYREIEQSNDRAIRQSLVEESYFSMCTPNGYTPFENEIQDYISDLVSPELAKTISTRISSSWKGPIVKPAPGEKGD